MQEEWRPVVGYEGFYEVSSLGNVRSQIVGRGRHAHPHSLTRKPARYNQRKGGYLAVRLQPPHWERKYHSVHRLVAKAFLPNPAAKPVVNHLNGVQFDNQLENLQWATYSENNTHALRTGLRKPTAVRGEKNKSAKLNSDQVREIRRLHKEEGLGNRKLSHRFGVARSTILNIIKGRKWAHLL